MRPFGQHLSEELPLPVGGIPHLSRLSSMLRDGIPTRKILHFAVPSPFLWASFAVSEADKELL